MSFHWRHQGDMLEILDGTGSLEICYNKFDVGLVDKDIISTKADDLCKKLQEIEDKQDEIDDLETEMNNLEIEKDDIEAELG